MNQPICRESSSKMIAVQEMARQRERDLEALRLAKEQEADLLSKGKLESKRIGNTTYIASPKKLKDIELKYKAEQAEKLAKEDKRTAPIKARVILRSEDVRKRTQLIWDRMCETGEQMNEACKHLGLNYWSVSTTTRMSLGFDRVREANEAALRIYNERNQSNGTDN